MKNYYGFTFQFQFRFPVENICAKDLRQGHHWHNRARALGCQCKGPYNEKSTRGSEWVIKIARSSTTPLWSLIHKNPSVGTQLRFWAVRRRLKKTNWTNRSKSHLYIFWLTWWRTGWWKVYAGQQNGSGLKEVSRVRACAMDHVDLRLHPALYQSPDDKNSCWGSWVGALFLLYE